MLRKRHTADETGHLVGGRLTSSCRGGIRWFVVAEVTNHRCLEFGPGTVSGRVADGAQN